ncbi:MAG: hypothetical protein Q9211_004422 [Gyalolechia sp. 1 TL-2023]
MAPVYKIAVIQLHPQPMRIEANYAKAAQFIHEAARQGAQLAVLPEYHLTNWIPEDPNFSHLCGQWEFYLNKYRTLAKEHNICIVPGTIVERHEDEQTKEQKLTNVAYFIDNEGQLLGTRSDCSPYGLSTNPQTETLFLDSVLTARAFENTCAVIFVNAGGPAGSSHPHSNYAGLSRVAVPFLGALGGETRDSSVEGMSVVDLDMRHVEEAEANYKVREDLAREDWYYIYRRGRTSGRETL